MAEASADGPARRQPDRSDEAGLPGPVAGVDEVGRGAWAGPLVAAAVILPEGPCPDGIDDSKLVPAPRRTALAGELRAVALWGVGTVEAAEIDRLGLTAANDLAMARAVDALPVRPGGLLLDGRRVPPGLGLPARAIVGGDALCLAIAAASILAKVARDARMVELDRTHPGYGWAAGKGYGTAAHRAGIARLGLSPQHRRCFRPVAQKALELDGATP